MTLNELRPRALFEVYWEVELGYDFICLELGVQGFRIQAGGGGWTDNLQSGTSEFNDIWELRKNVTLKFSDSLKITP